MRVVAQAIGLRIREMRTRRSWTQETFAHICGLDRSHVGAIERGECNVTLSTLHTLTTALNTTIEALFDQIA